MFVKENGKLLARVHENRGNILVYARVRPPTADEVAASDALEVVQILSDTGECGGHCWHTPQKNCVWVRAAYFQHYFLIL